MNTSEDSDLDPCTIINSETALNVANGYASRFKELIIQFGDAFFIITNSILSFILRCIASETVKKRYI